jgi:arabinan endo-1,5-alpha-L-arabinosidase
MIYHDGWYYLLATHGSCCRGADSGYNIRMGRAKKVTGPFLDHEGIDMIQGGGNSAASRPATGPGDSTADRLPSDLMAALAQLRTDLDTCPRSLVR